MITTVTLNPMLDKTVYVDAIRLGAIQRALRVDMVVGGKGVNVSRQLNHLDVETIATGFIGGEVGDIIERLLDEEDIAHDCVRVAGMTREGVTYRERDGTATGLFEPPHHVTHDEVQRFIVHAESLILRSEWIVCSGSSPCPDADDVYAAVIQSARGRSVKTLLDSYGTACRKAAMQHPTILKMNRQECEDTFGEKLEDENQYRTMFSRLLSYGISCCIITDGARPLYAATNEKLWRIMPPQIDVVNPTGSGDSMTAGILYAFHRGWSMERALKFGVAAGACNARQWDVANSSLADITAMELEVIIHTFT